MEFSLGLIYGQSSRNFSTKKKKKSLSNILQLFFLSFFFPLSPPNFEPLNFLHGEKFIASQLARLLDTIYRFPFPDRA